MLAAARVPAPYSNAKNVRVCSIRDIYIYIMHTSMSDTGVSAPLLIALRVVRRGIAQRTGQSLEKLAIYLLREFLFFYFFPFFFSYQTVALAAASNPASALLLLLLLPPLEPDPPPLLLLRARPSRLRHPPNASS